MTILESGTLRMICSWVRILHGVSAPTRVDEERPFTLESGTGLSPCIRWGQSCIRWGQQEGSLLWGVRQIRISWVHTHDTNSTFMDWKRLAWANNSCDRFYLSISCYLMSIQDAKERLRSVWAIEEVPDQKDEGNKRLLLLLCHLKSWLKHATNSSFCSPWWLRKMELRKSTGKSPDMM